MAKLTRHLIDDFDEFQALRDEWNAVLERSEWPNPSLRHEWLDAWWTGFGDSATPQIVVMRDGKVLTAAVPLMVSRRTLTKIPVRVLHSMALDLASCGFLGHVATQEQLDLMIGETLRRSGCDVAILRGITAGSEIDRTFQTFVRDAGLACRVTPYKEVHLEAKDGLEAFEKGRRSKFRANVRNRRKRIAKEGKVEFTRIRDSSNVEAVMRDVFDVSRRSWKGEAGTAIGMQENYRKGYGRLVELLGSRNEADVAFLKVNGQPIAYRLGYRSGPVFFELDIAFDREWSRFSPGSLLATHHNALIIEEGVSEINLGPYFSWKDEWSPDYRIFNEYVIYGPRLRSHVTRNVHRVRDWIEKRWKVGKVGARS